MSALCKRGLSFIFSGVLFFFLSGPAQAKMFPLWEAGLGIGGLYMPVYRGSDEYQGFALPYPYVIYRGEWLNLDRERIRGFFWQTDRLKLDVSGNAALPVDSSKIEVRQGMPDLDPTFELGPSLEWLVAEDKTRGYKLTFLFPVRAVFSVDFPRVIHQGWTFSPRINLDLYGGPPQKDWYIGIGLGPTFGDKTFHDYYYRVDQAYAAPGRPAYSASAGYGGMQLAASFGKYFNKLWMGLFARADFLQGAAFADSPLVRVETNLLVGFAISYIFLESKTFVDAEK
jgi:outer membrane scaffolding protein for murein synthesis (MipA/OmpV family)